MGGEGSGLYAPFTVLSTTAWAGSSLLQPVLTIPRTIEPYRPIVGDAPLAEIRALAEPLRGKRVLHVNATAFGGGVAELLGAVVPLMRDAGLQAEWRVIQGADEFFTVTKAMHNSLQGMALPWHSEMFELWRRYNALNAQLFGDQAYDFVVVHDPQPAGVLAELARLRGARPPGKWLWRCHIDLTAALPEVWAFLRPYVEQYDAAIFTLAEYVKQDLRVPLVAIVPPAIDPLSTKNMDLSAETVAQVLARYGIDASRPIITQVSRFDPWKDPLGVIDAYRLVKRVVPEVQLLLVASMASDDPEGWSYYERAAHRAGGDRDIHLLTNLEGVGNTEVNVFQRCSQVVIQKSIREGFGLVVSEGLWKGRPVVGGNTGGIPLQVLDGTTGFLVRTVEACAEKTLSLLQHPDEADRMGAAGREHVRQHFLITRLLRDWLRVFNQLAEGG
ncbi:MAG: glycosyltransferase [Chloroflexi bacterium]|nr:glycosyltransferase [Chloroflexota bacterium]